MIQNNLLESETALFLRKEERKKDIRLKGGHCLPCLTLWYHPITFARILYLHSFYPEFFSRGPVLPVGLVTKQVTRDTGAGSWPKMVLDEEKALLSEEIVFEKVKFSLFYLLYCFRFRITSSCGILALYAPISPIDCADTIRQWNRRPL